MQETTLAQLGNYGALGAISAVAIWGVVKGIGALWSALERREERLEQAYREFSARLEKANAEVSGIARASAEELALLRGVMDSFAKEAADLNKRLALVCEGLEESLSARDSPRLARPVGGANSSGRDAA